MRRRTILITGSAGQLGGSLVNHLKDAHAVIQLDRREPVGAAQRGIGPVFTGSITDSGLVERAMEGADAVIHCAAIPSNSRPFSDLIATNVLGTFNVLEAAGNRASVEHVISISSIQWYGLSEQPYVHVPHFLPINETHPSLATDCYSCSKVQAEYWCANYARRFGKRVVVVQPPWIARLSLEPTFEAGPAPDYPYLCDYVATSDLIDGIVRCLDYDPPDGFDRFLFHAADQRSTTPTLDLVKRHWPDVAVNREKLSACDGFGAMVDTSHAVERLGWRPKYRCER